MIKPCHKGTVAGIACRPEAGMEPLLSVGDSCGVGLA